MKVDILSPRRDYPSRIADSAIMAMALHSANEGVDVSKPDLHATSLPAHSRNQALSQIRDDADYVLWCDDDMHPEKDALLMLLEHDADAVSALCTTRDYMPVQIAAYAYQESTDTFCPLGAYDGADLEHTFKPGVRVIKSKFGVGGAFLLVRKRLIDEAIEFHLSARDWEELHRAQFGRLKVRAENRERERQRIEAARRKMYDKGEIYLFQHPFDPTYRVRGEDIHFSWLLLKLGYEIWIDTKPEVLHMGSFGYGPSLLGITDRKELRV